jgi:hypothetical protein
MRISRNHPRNIRVFMVIANNVEKKVFKHRNIWAHREQ